MPSPWRITEHALEAQGIDDADVGDVVLVRTGWNSLWKDYNAPRRRSARQITLNTAPANPD